MTTQETSQPPPDDEPELSIEDLGQAYAAAMAAQDPDTYAAMQDSPERQPADSSEPDDAPESFEDPSSADEAVPTPEAIVEGALFVGHPDNESLSAVRLASLMRDVTPEEVVAIIDGLNRSYQEHHQALRITPDEGGYRMSVAPAVESVRRSFYGKIREARLSQAAIEVLALVAYQPGIDGPTINDQRGQDSGTILNQLVRRDLLSLRRETPRGGGRPVPHYDPTERFLVLFNLDSLDDLPQVEEGLREF